jgi:exodeoxyribonuclease-3
LGGRAFFEVTKRMEKRRIVSWNVNGLRAVLKKGFLTWLDEISPDVLCIQETKAEPGVLPERAKTPPGYVTYWNSALRKGYSGVAAYTRETPLSVLKLIGVEEFDGEGRILAMEYSDFILVNVYFPNGKSGSDRLRFKLDFYEECLLWFDRLRSERRKGLVLTGDVNTAHREIDLARPKENSRVSGFLPEERQWIDRLLSHGYADTFRHLHPDRMNAYTWWDYKTHARERNVGWRIDYFFVSSDLLPRVTKSEILADVTGSDHCPILLELA